MAHRRLSPEEWRRQAEPLKALIEAYGKEAIFAAAGFLASGDPSRAGWARTVLSVEAERLRKCVRPRGRPPKPRPPRGRPGRPRRAIDHEAVIRVLREAASLRAAAQQLAIPRTTLNRVVAEQGLDTLAAYPAALRERHARLLVLSGVTPPVAKARGYHSLRVARLGDTLVIPIWSVAGHQVWSQHRIDAPRKRSYRYENGPGARAVLDVSPAGRGAALDPDGRLYVTESPRKADAAVSRGLACVAIMGVRMLTLDDDEWSYLGIAGREVCIAFDGDAGSNPEVAQAESSLRAYLAERGATVRVLRLPGRMGLDDFLATGKTEDDLLALEVRPSDRPLPDPGPSSDAPPAPYATGRTEWSGPLR